MEFTIDMLFLVACIVAGIVAFFQNRIPLYLKLLCVYLVLVLANETIGSIMLGRRQYTTLLYNFFLIMQFTFYLFVISRVIRSQKIKKIITGALFLFLTLALCNLLFGQGINTFNSLSFALGCLLIVSFSVYFFFELFQYPHFVNLVREPAFWICTAFLFYFCCVFPVVASLNFMKDIPAFLLKNYRSLLELFNVLLYLLFTVAFLCRIRVPNLTS